MDVFGLEHKETGVSSKSGREFWVIGDPEKFYLCLHQAPQGHALEGGRFNHFGVHVDDFSQFLQRVQQLNVPTLYGGVVQWPKSKSIYLQGPDNEEIEVSERYGGGLG